MMTDTEIESFIKQHASIEKGIALAIAWQQVLVLRDIADALAEMANPVMMRSDEQHRDQNGENENEGHS